MDKTTGTSYDVSYDMESGWPLAVHLHGHHDDETALALAWSIFAFEQMEAPHGVSSPFRTYVRAVPSTDEYGYFQSRYVYGDKPGRGAKAVTVVEASRGRWHLCEFCPWDATIGVPTADHDITLYLCQGHLAAYRELQSEMTAANMAACPDCGHRAMNHRLLDGEKRPHVTLGPPPNEPTDRCVGDTPWRAIADCSCAHIAPSRLALTYDAIKKRAADADRPARGE